jgi:signal transduction histidine kinase
VYQDADGMIWFCTDQGVSRYNGLEFQNFSTKDGLTDNDIFHVTNDYEGRLWMATYNGTLCFYKNGIFHNAKNTPFLRVREKNELTHSVQLLPDSSVIITFSEPGKFLEIRHDKVIPHYVQEMFSGDRILYVVRQDPDTLQVHTFHHAITVNRQDQFISKKPVLWTAVYNHRGQFLYRLGSKLYDAAGKYIREVNKKFNLDLVSKIYRTPEHLFLCTNYGLIMDDTLLFPGQWISGVLQDRQGTYWVTSLGKGVMKIPGHFERTWFREQAYTTAVSHSLQEPGAVIFGTEDMNLYRLTDTGIHCLFQMSRQLRAPHKNAVYTIFPSGENYYLYSLNGGTGINGRNGRVFSLHRSQISLSLRDVIRTKKKQLCVNTRNCIYLIPEADLFIPGNINDLKQVTGTDTNGKKYLIRQDKDSCIWYTSKNGVYKITDSIAVRQYQFGSLSFRQMLFCKNFLCGIDESGRLILCRDYNSPDITIDSAAGIDCIWDKLFPLTDSSILVTTGDYYRIITFGSKSYRINTLEYPFMPQLAEWIHSTGQKCYFFKNGTITGVPVRSLIALPGLPELFFTAVKCSDRQIAAAPYLKLDYNSSRKLSIIYRTLSFNTTDILIEYSISAQGAPDNWTRSNGSEIDLFNVAQGEYTVRIRARTFGDRYSVVKTLQLRIGPPFWMSWWFLGSVVLAAATAIFLVLRRYTRRRLLQKEKENKFLRAEFTALNALMNPHFVFNSLNSVQSLINKEDLHAANQYVRTISDLLRQNMHNISRELIPLKQEMELISNYLKLEKLRFKERLQYTINIDEEVEEEFLLVPPLLVQPLVENAIKYTLAFSEIDTGHIRIDIYCRDLQVIIAVTDNGKGLNAAKIGKAPGHESTALGNIRKRLEQLSLIHGKSYGLEIIELRGEDYNIKGTSARISIEL